MTQKGLLIRQASLAPILIVLILLTITFFFLPIPYYQDYSPTCKIGQLNCLQKGWHSGLSFWDKLTEKPTQSASRSIPVPLPQKPKTAEEYCKSVNSNPKYAQVQSIRDCGEYKITTLHGCLDCGNAILDKEWNEIDSCGGFAGWSKECQEKYPAKETCIITSCIK